MPYIHCTIQSGMSPAKKRELALELAKAVHQSLGSPMQYVHVAVSEVPANEFVESGKVGVSYPGK